MSTEPPANKNGESAAHRELKRLALIWAQGNGFRIAAAEVSLPDHGVRADVAAYKPERVRESRRDERTKKMRKVSRPAVGVTAIFECKVSQGDFIRDARSMKATLEKLESLHLRKEKVEAELRIHYPSIRNGDSLFQEYETLNFERSGYERYEKVMGQIRQLSARLHGNTKFDRLTKYAAANLYYVVAEPGLVSAHSLPCGWGLLERGGESLMLREKPHWHDVAEDRRLGFLHRLSLAATRAVNRENGIVIVDPRWNRASEEALE